MQDVMHEVYGEPLITEAEMQKKFKLPRKVPSSLHHLETKYAKVMCDIVPGKSEDLKQRHKRKVHFLPSKRHLILE